MAKGQLRSNREKKKPKAEKNKKKSAPMPSVIRARTDDWERRFRQEVLVAQSASIPRRKVRSDELTRCQSQHWERRASPNVIKNSLDPALCADELEFSSQAYASAYFSLRSL